MVEELDSALALIRTASALVGAVTCIWRMYRKIRGDRPQVVPLSMRARAGRPGSRSPELGFVGWFALYRRCHHLQHGCEGTRLYRSEVGYKCPSRAGAVSPSKFQRSCFLLHRQVEI